MAYDKVLHALADPTRRAVFERLRAGRVSVGDLAGTLPVSRPAVSQHLKVLKEAGLVLDEAEGTRRFYSVDQRGVLALRTWLDHFWDASLASFKAEVERSSVAADAASSAAPATPPAASKQAKRSTLNPKRRKGSP